MELRMPTPEQLRTVYAADLKESFPASELKPLRAIEQMWADGRYYPWCLFDGDEIVGTCFLWMGHPGWALLDYLCRAYGYKPSSAKRYVPAIKHMLAACGFGEED